MQYSIIYALRTTSVYLAITGIFERQSQYFLEKMHVSIITGASKGMFELEFQSGVL